MAGSQSTIGYKPSAFSLLEVIVTNAFGKTLRAHELCSEFSIFEDIFNSAIFLEMTFLDGQGILERFPMVGDETVQIQIRDSEDAPTLTETFKIYKVSDRTRIKERVDMYVVYGVSQEFISDRIDEGVSKAYTGTKVSGIVSDIFQKGGLGNPGSDLEMEQTLNELTFTPTKNSPTEAINLLARESIHEKYMDSSYYLFYRLHKLPEDQKKYKFKTLNSLLKEAPKEPMHVFALKAQHAADTEAGRVDTEEASGTTENRYQSIEAISFGKTFDILKGHIQGFYGNTLKCIDPVMKIYHEYDWNYYEDFDTVRKELRTPAMKQLTSQTLYKDRRKNAHSRFVITDFNNSVENKELDGRITPSSPYDGLGSDNHKYWPRERHKLIPGSLILLSQLNQYTLTVQAPGAVDLRAGNMVSIDIPQNEPIVSANPTEGLLHFGQLTGGPKPWFLVTAIKYTFNILNTSFIMTFECASESFQRDPVSDPPFDEDG
jgi:hypothetical protein